MTPTNKRDEIVEVLKEEFCETRNTFAIGVATDRLLALVEKETQWVACSERTPDNTHIHLVCRKYGNRTLGWFDGELWFTGAHFRIDDTVTHWMELPQPPTQ